VIFEGLSDEYWGYIETMYPEGLGCLFDNTSNDIWDFFEYLAHETW